jgi:hypothetical protein
MGFAALNPSYELRTNLPRHIILFAEVVAEFDDHRDAFGVAGLGDGFFVGIGPEFPGVFGPEHENFDAIRTVGVDLELRSHHRNQFGFSLARLAHDGGFLRQQICVRVPLRPAPVDSLPAAH